MARSVSWKWARGNIPVGGFDTQIPKLLGSLARYIASSSKTDRQAARFFWEAVVNHHSFATGGHGKDEYFFAPSPK